MARRDGIAVGLCVALSACSGADKPTAPVLAPSAPPQMSAPSPPPVAANQPPVLQLKLTPERIRGAFPLTVDLNMCRSTDPDGEGLQFAYEWAAEGKRLSSECRASRTYESPIRSVAYFCVWDGHPEHLVCRSFKVDVS